MNGERIKDRLYLALAFLIRLCLFRMGVGRWLESRVEINTPFNAWKRVREGLALRRAGISPYEGDTVHCNPIFLIMFEFVDSKGPLFTSAIFSAADLITAILLYKATKMYRIEAEASEASCVKQYAEDAKKLLLKRGDEERVARRVMICYLFNPFSIASCVCMTLTTLNNLVLACILFTVVQGCSVVCFTAIAFAALTEVYPGIFLFPALATFRKDGLKSTLTGVVTAIGALSLFTALSYSLAGDWSFLKNTVGSILDLSDLTPNVGLFWYFFSEAFEQYRLFFLCVFHLTSLTYALPLSYSLRKDTFSMCYFILFTLTLFKSYPSVGDSALHFSLVPAFSHLFIYLRYSFIMMCMFGYCLVLSPMMWHMWIEMGSANANFFFAVTLVYSVAQIFLMTGLFYARYRRCFHLKYGLKVLLNGKEVLPVLD